MDGVFIAVGILPNTDKIEGLPKLDENGYILAGEDTKTSIPWIFAGGDVRKKRIKADNYSCIRWSKCCKFNKKIYFFCKIIKKQEKN